MTAFRLRASARIAAAAIGVVWAACPAAAQRGDDRNWIAPPLEAIGKAIGRMGRGADRLIPPAVKPKRPVAPKGGSARKRPTGQSKPRASVAAPKAKAATQQARLPRARPAESPGKRPPAAAQGESAPPAMVPETEGLSRLTGQDPPSSPVPGEEAAKGLNAMPLPKTGPPDSSDTPDAAGTGVAAVPAPPAAASVIATTPPPFPAESMEAEAAEGLARLPQARPAAEPPATSELARVDPAGPEPSPPPPAPAAPAGDERACLARLGALGVVFQVVPPIDAGGECPVPAPLELSSLGSGVAVNPKAVLNCRTAEALALWVRDVVVPAAQAQLNAVPTEISESSTYVCRTRNNAAGEKMSEHASANAVDIGAIGFAHRPPHRMAPGAAETPDGRFQSAVQDGACRYFTTVLAPGSDAAHPDHMHLDMAERRNGYRICDLDPPETAGGAPPNTNRE